MTPVPADFISELNAADAAKLMLLRLELEGLPWQQEALALFPADVAEQAPVDRLILFTGHRIDSADRNTPRFPAAAEPLARTAIENVVQQQIGLAHGAMLGVAGGANGGDILFLESCRQADVPAEMLLALPPDQFIPASVSADSGDWLTRFQTLLEQCPVSVLAETKELPDWLRAKPDYDIWQRNNLWLFAYALSRKPTHLVLVALWDGKGGDGPGGTEHMVHMAQDRAAEVIILKTTELFSLKAS